MKIVFETEHYSLKIPSPHTVWLHADEGKRNLELHGTEAWGIFGTLSAIWSRHKAGEMSIDEVDRACEVLIENTLRNYII